MESDKIDQARITDKTMIAIVRILCMCLTILLAACQRENQETITIYDKRLIEDILNESRATKVKIEVRGNIIVYAVNDRAAVEAIVSKAETLSHRPFAFQTREHRDSFVRRLQEERISTTTSDAGNAFVAYVPPSELSRASTVFREVLARSNEGE